MGCVRAAQLTRRRPARAAGPPAGAWAHVLLGEEAVVDGAEAAALPTRVPACAGGTLRGTVRVLCRYARVPDARVRTLASSAPAVCAQLPFAYPSAAVAGVPGPRAGDAVGGAPRGGGGAVAHGGGRITHGLMQARGVYFLSLTTTLMGSGSTGWMTRSAAVRLLS